MMIYARWCVSAAAPKQQQQQQPPPDEGDGADDGRAAHQMDIWHTCRCRSLHARRRAAADCLVFVTTFVGVCVCGSVGIM